MTIISPTHGHWPQRDCGNLDWLRLASDSTFSALIVIGTEIHLALFCFAFGSHHFGGGGSRVCDRRRARPYHVGEDLGNVWSTGWVSLRFPNSWTNQVPNADQIDEYSILTGCLIRVPLCSSGISSCLLYSMNRPTSPDLDLVRIALTERTWKKRHFSQVSDMCFSARL